MTQTDVPGATFTSKYVEADGFRIRYLEAGQGQPLVWFHGAGGPHLTRTHDLLAEHYRVLAFEVPGFGQSPANERSSSYPDLAATMAEAIRGLGVQRYSLWGTSFGGRLALWTAFQVPERIDALVLEAPAAIVPEGSRPPAGSPEEMRQRLFAHPERQTDWRPAEPAVAAKQRALLTRLGTPSRQETEDKLSQLNVPTLVIFGTEDRLIPPEMGRIYREKMPNCQYVLVYDAGHEAGADRPEAVSSLISDFLERHEAFIVNQKSGLIFP